MNWRWVPPVSSPVAPGEVARGAFAAAGIADAPLDDVRAELAGAFGARSVTLTDSGTSALVLAFRALVPRDGVVALPAYACIDLVAAAIGAGVRVRFYDLDPGSMSPEPGSLRATLGRGADAILVAPLYGYPVDMPAVAALAGERGIPVIEDAAQGAGSTLGGVRVGSFGAVSVLSFGRGKGTTGGSGGALLVHDAVLVDRCAALAAELGPPSRGWRDVCLLAAQWALGRPSLYAIPSSIPALRLGEMVYHAPRDPRPISAAAARMVQWALAADGVELARRRANARELEAACAGSTGFVPISHAQGSDPGFLRLAVRDMRRAAAPSPRLGALRSYPITLDEHPATASVLLPGESAGAGARMLRDELFTLPTHSATTGDDRRRLHAWLRSTPTTSGSNAVAPARARVRS